VLLHHVMGEVEGQRGVWAYVEGGMGGVSKALSLCAQSHGAEIRTSQEVSSITSRNGKAAGLVLKSGEEIKAKVVLSNATPKVTFLDLLEENSLSEDFVKSVRAIDYSSATMKINGKQGLKSS